MIEDIERTLVAMARRGTDPGAEAVWGRANDDAPHRRRRVRTRRIAASLAAVVVLAGLAVTLAGRSSGTHQVVVAPHTATTPAHSPAVPSRLETPITLNNGLWYLAPPRATDTTALTYAEAVHQTTSFTSEGLPTEPIAALARFTNKFDTSGPPPSIQGLTGNLGFAPQPHDKLVIVVVSYGPRPYSGGPAGFKGPLPTGLSTYGTTVWLEDPTTGKGLWGESYPGPPPQISTTPAAG